MGCFSSKVARGHQFPGYEDPIFLASRTAFTVSEVQALFEMFKTISSTVIDDGLISKEEFQLALFENRKKEDLLANRIFDLFDLKQRGVVDFEDFVMAMNVFHPNASQEDKLTYRRMKLHFVLLQFHLSCMIWMAQGILNDKRLNKC
uniref:Calcineurin B-like protein n=1 Tax=Solanum tuberosum TaxID=4113 RepID=M1BTZ8_SOLTU